MSPADEDRVADAWDEALDRFEACLASGERFEPPADLGPMPLRVVPRARALLAACDARRRELAAERDRVVADLRSSQRLHRATGSSAARDHYDRGLLV